MVNPKIPFGLIVLTNLRTLWSMITKTRGSRIRPAQFRFVGESPGPSVDVHLGPGGSALTLLRGLVAARLCRLVIGGA